MSSVVVIIWELTIERKHLGCAIVEVVDGQQVHILHMP